MTATISGDGTSTLINLTTSGNTILGDASTDTLNVGNGGLVKDASGNVGIGTSSVTSGVKLQVQSTGGTVLLIKDTTSGSGDYSNIWFGDEALDYSGYLGYNHGTDAMTFGTAATERMRIDSSGNVGIGTSSPGAKLNVDGAALGSKIKLSNNTSGRGALDGFDLDFTGTDIYITNRENGSMIFENNGAERARIDSSGKLLVGTTSLLTSDDTGGIYWSSATGSGGAGGFEFRNTSTSTSSDPNPALIIIKGSTTYTSSQRFIQFNANAGTQAMGGIVGNGATNAQFISLSDAREKENIEPITGSLNKITSLNPVEFDWKQTGEHIKAGFIAQEVELVFPEYVVDNVANAGEEERKGLTGGMSAGFIAHLVKAIQEMKAIIDTQASTITALQADVADLKGTP